MTLYSLFQPSGKDADIVPLAVADQFSWLAALLPPVYALLHGLWLLLAGWIVVVVALGVSGRWLGPDAGFWLYLLLAVLLGFEAPALRRAKLLRRGFSYCGEVVAAGEDLAQTEFLRRLR